MSKSRGEELLETLVNGEDSDIKPQSRMEEYLLAAIKKSGTDGLPKPISRGDALLHQLVDVISNGSGGGGDTPITPVGEETVNFYDYDGTLVHSYTVEEAQALEELPELPTREGFTYQGWNWSLEDIKSRNIAVDVGAMCVTSDGKTRIHIRLKEGRTSPKVAFGLDGTASVDWGDGTEPDVVKGVSTDIITKTPTHNYSNIGDYVISISVTSGTIVIMGDTSGHSRLLVHDTTSSGLSSDTKKLNVGYNSCIEKVELGSGVTSLRGRCFQNCSSLKSINIPNSVTSIGDYVFESSYGSSLEFISIPNSVTSIDSNVFSNCNKLKIISFPNRTPSLSNTRYLFSGCESLKRISIPSETTSIKINMFYDCSSLKSINLPEGITSIGSSAFYNCRSLETIKLPDGITSIDGNAFYSCQSLKSINIPESLQTIKDSTFYNCRLLETIKLPDGITSIGANAFDECRSLESINLPEGITSIGAKAFNNCKLLETVNIPNTLTELANGVFYSCCNFKSIIIPNGITSIGSNTFYGCINNLTKVIVLGTLSSIGAYAFANCSFVKYYDFSSHTSVPTLSNTNAFNNMHADCEILVPASLYEEWKAATNWSTYADNIKVKENA